jgi:mRNA interferase RelE/StbE
LSGPWKVELTETAKRQLRKVGVPQSKRITDYLGQRLAFHKDPRTSGKALAGPLKGLWRYRVGDHRIICKIQDQEIVILVIEIGDRKDVYR